MHRNYWRDVPLRRLTSLLLAIFFLFGMVGCFVDLLDLGQKPFVPVIAWSLFSGFIAVVWILAFFRDPRWLIGAVVLWLVGSATGVVLLHQLGAIRTPHARARHPRRTIACMILSFSAYSFFML